MTPSPEETPLRGIAVIGMSGRFPRARNTEEFWKNLVDEVDCISHFSDDELEHSSAPPNAAARKQKFVKARGVLPDVDLFDAAFFGIFPREAEVMDPQHRVFLECAWEALEHGGYDPDTYSGLIGVFASLSLNTYLIYNLCADRQFNADFAGNFQVGQYHTMFGNDKDFLPTRVSYRLNLRGPSMAVQSACSSSLVAVTQACNSLLLYQSDMVLAGGVSISFPQRRDYLYTEDAMVSVDGTCRAFDADARGTVFGHGAGVVLLKRLEDALTDRDNILAVIRGTAVNNDGAQKIGYAAPGVSGQAEAIAIAHAAAGVHPKTISYVEAHGTGTPMGDPIEVAALTQAFRSGGATDNGFCAIGSGKTHVGHLDAAAGVTGLIKTVLQLQHEAIPPLLHFQSPNPRIEFADSPFFPASRLIPWKRGLSPRRAGVSAFGVGGTNAHIVVEEAPLPSVAAPDPGARLLVVSARSQTALETATQNLAAHIETRPAISLPDVAFTLGLGRRGFPYRRAVVAADVAGAVRALRSAATCADSPLVPAHPDPSVVFMFPGQGAQYPGMGKGLYESEPVYRRELDCCADLFQQHLRRDIRRILFPESKDDTNTANTIHQTLFAQPCIFATEFALARLWMSWGVQPSVIIGHSIGEYVAAVIAGTFSLDDAIALVATRARLMNALPAGAMLAVRLGVGEIEAMLPLDVSIAASNSPTLVTVSGPVLAIEQFHRELEQRQVTARMLQTSHAFHSAMMEPMLADFATAAAGIRGNPPAIRWLSTCTGTWMTPETVADPSYWARQVRQTVRFTDAIDHALADERNVLIEVGPGQALGQLIRQHPTRAPGLTIIGSIIPDRIDGAERSVMLASLGAAWTAGVPVAWSTLFAGESGRRISLPTYPFERKKSWIEAPRSRPIRSENEAEEPPDIFTPPAEDDDSLPSSIAAGTPPSLSVQRDAEIIWQLAATFEQLSGIAVTDTTRSFIELGADSLLLTEFSQVIKVEFGTEVSLRQLMGEYASIDALAGYLDSQRSAEQDKSRATSADTTNVRAVEDPIIIPVSEEQKEIWLASNLRPELACAYNDVLVVGIEGDLVTSNLQEALADIVRRHEALRATFRSDGESQIIGPPVNPAFCIEDVTSLSAEEQDRRIDDAAADEDKTPFNLEKGPLLRIRLFKRRMGLHTLLLAYHHIIVDGWSAGVLIHDLAAVYAARRAGTPALLEPCLRYRDFVHWQNSPAHVAEVERAERYWIERLADLPPSINIPTDRPRAGLDHFESARRTLDLEDTLCAQITEIFSRLECTTFCGIFAVFTAWLHRVSGQSDFIVGIPNAGQLSAGLRTLPGGENLVGHCVNFLPVRVNCESGTPFSDHARHVRDCLLDAQENQCVTFGGLIKRINPPRDPGRAPLTSVVFNYIPFGSEPLEIDGLTWHAGYHGKSTNFFDLVVYITSHGASLRINCEFRTGLFDVATIDRWLGEWHAAVMAIVQMPETSVGQMQLLTVGEQRRLSLEWNSTGTDYRREDRIHELFETQAVRTPNATAIVFQNKRLSYNELDARANGIARELISAGCASGSRIGICVERSLDMVAGVLGILKSGAAYVPIDPFYPRERIGFIIEDAELSLILSESSLFGTLPTFDIPIIALDSLRAGDAKIGAPRVAGGGGDLAYLMFTSGSTGRPKGVQIHHRAVVNFLNSMRREPGLTPNDTLLAVTTLSFDIAVLELFLPLTTGACVAIASREVAMDGRELQNELSRVGATVLQATPVTWRLLLEAGWNGNRRLKILCGGEPLPHDLAAQLIPRCSELWNMYGPTETTVWSTCCRITDAGSIHIGRPIDNTQVYIVSEGLTLQPTGAPGELLIGGDGVSSGYIGRDEETADRFIADPFGDQTNARLYRTGDLGRWRTDGNLECLGRLDHQVKIRGFRIELEEVETVLARQSGVRQGVVVARDDGHGAKNLVAYLVWEPGATSSAVELRAGMRSTLPEYMVPSIVIALEALPLTPNGKLDRNALPQPDHHERLEAPAATSPDNAIEQRLVSIYGEVLGLSEIGTSESFFDLGGNSLVAVKLMSQIEAEFGRRLPLALLFSAPSIRSLAAHIAAADRPYENEKEWQVLVPISVHSNRPILFMVHGAGGNVLLYHDLARRLAPEVSVFGFQSLGLDRKRQPLRSVEEMADHYISELRAFQPHGPYFLAGYCMGGMVAYEMASKLRRQGAEVALVAMLDSYNLSRIPVSVRQRRRISIWCQKILFHLDNLRRLPASRLWNYFVEKIRLAAEHRHGIFSFKNDHAAKVSGDQPIPLRDVLDYVQRINDEAAWSYKPAAGSGSFLIVKPARNYDFMADPFLGWGQLVGPEFEVIELPVNPHAMLIDPFNQLLASELIDRVKSRVVRVGEQGAGDAA